VTFHRFPDGRPRREQPRWRRDFPVETSADDDVTRRDFARFLGLISGGLALGQLWILLVSRLRRGAPPARRVAAVDDVPIGGALVFHYPGPDDPCLLLRRGPREFVAFSQRCTHLACAVQPDPDGARLFCPCHRGWFDAADGQPLAGPPERPLPRITLELRGGSVTATGVELST
jgi:Rieske Fe-S protein